MEQYEDGGEGGGEGGGCAGCGCAGCFTPGPLAVGVGAVFSLFGPYSTILSLDGWVVDRNGLARFDPALFGGIGMVFDTLVIIGLILAGLAVLDRLLRTIVPPRRRVGCYLLALAGFSLLLCYKIQYGAGIAPEIRHALGTPAPTAIFATLQAVAGLGLLVAPGD